MTVIEFKKTLDEKEPPENLSVYRTALWYDAKGDWNKAHQIIQNVEDKNASAIHAYLHRKEGDIGNADYWYRRAAKKREHISLEKEWEQLVTELQ